VGTGQKSLQFSPAKLSTVGLCCYHFLVLGDVLPRKILALLDRKAQTNRIHAVFNVDFVSYRRHDTVNFLIHIASLLRVSLLHRITHVPAAHHLHYHH